ncbi:MAG: DEAD/DEAH box helicase, partial [Myxococcota bacterium]
FLPIRTACVYGGTRIQKQIAELKTASIAVGTPGRLLDHIGRRTMDLSKLEAIVLDEVDRMYDLGFREDVDRILKAASARNQTLLMSATLNDDVERLIAKHIGEHERILIESKSLTVDEVDQAFYFVDPRRKQDLLAQLIEDQKPECGIVFVRTRFSTDRLAHRLRELGFDCREIHSGLPQRKREQILKGFRDGRFPLLVATDVAARGLDIEGVTHVFNYDIPQVAEDYVHRIGRTARMGRRGVGISLITTDDGQLLTQIEMLINKEIEQKSYPGFELKRREAPKKPEPPKTTGIQQWRNVRRRRR